MTEQKPSQPYRRLGDFELIRELGRGGMGVVYEARQVSLNRKVALKVLAGGLGLSSDAVLRFRREAEAAARLHHTNIVPVYATGDQDGTHFYAMELVEGPSLDQVIRETRTTGHESGPTSLNFGQEDPDATLAHQVQGIAPARAPGASTSSSHSSSIKYFDQVARLMADVADALGYAHRQGIVHRDIKPSNLLMSPDGRLSINDFGLARVLEEPGMTATGEMLGTPAYMSPEQITAGRTPLDHRTDIYSLGATLYELLTLQPPFRGERRDQLLAQILHKDPVSPRRLDKKIPVDLETICLKAMDKDPDRRYQSGSELAEDLRRYVNRFAISARRVGVGTRLIKAVKRNPATALAAVVTAAAILIAGFFSWQAYRSEQARAEERQLAIDELSRVKRENSLENAFTAATSGDLAKADAAIADAIENGASASQVHLLQGQVAFFRGDAQESLVNLQNAVRLDPRSVSAQGMLALAYDSLSQYPKYEETMITLDTLSPKSATDFLIKGSAECTANPARALSTLNNAVSLGASPLARAVRARARMNLAEDSSDLRQAEMAVEDGNAALQFLPDNPYVLSISLLTHLVAANLYQQKGDSESQASSLKKATGNAASLMAFEGMTHPTTSLWVYYSQTGQNAEALRLMRRVVQRTDSTMFDFFFAMQLYRNGDLGESLSVIQQSKATDVFKECIQAQLLAELHPEDLGLARSRCAELTKRYSSGVSAFFPLELHCFLGDIESAAEAAKSLRAKNLERSPFRGEIYLHLLNYYCGEMPDEQLLTLCAQSRWIACEAHLAIGLRHLARGDRAKAKEHFRLAVEPNLVFYYEADVCRLLLARMEQDPSWPAWIPVNK